MTEKITNKELAKLLMVAHDRLAGEEPVFPGNIADIKFAAERLAAMPDAGERYERLRSAAESWGHQTGLWNTSHSEHAGETVRTANKLISALEERLDAMPDTIELCSKQSESNCWCKNCVAPFKPAPDDEYEHLHKTIELLTKQLVKAESKETIKRYCTDYLIYVLSLDSQKLDFDEFWQQQSAEGGEWYGKPDSKHESWCQLDDQERGDENQIK